MITISDFDLSLSPFYDVRYHSTDRSNWQDWGGRWARRTQFMRNLKNILEDLDVRYTLPVQPVLLPRTSPLNFNPFTNPYSNPYLGPNNMSQGPGLGRSATVAGLHTSRTSVRGQGHAGQSVESLSLRESLGNAGYVDAGEMGRAPGAGSAGSVSGSGVRIRVSGDR